MGPVYEYPKRLNPVNIYTFHILQHGNNRVDLARVTRDIYKEMDTRKRHRVSFIRLMTWFKGRIYNKTGLFDLDTASGPLLVSWTIELLARIEANESKCRIKTPVLKRTDYLAAKQRK